MSWNERLFVIIPLLSVMCNVFLLLTVASVKKDKLIDAFIGLLLTFTAWSIGSLFLRMKLFPGPEFWYMISITGIFLVPFSIYNFVYRYTNTKGGFIRGVLLVTWAIISILNLSNVFVTDPRMVFDGVEWRFEYGISGWTVIPIVLTVFTLLQAAALIIEKCKNGDVPARQFVPMFFGVGVMFAGTVSAILPQMVSIPIDTFSCSINAVCLYYMLYKRRVVQLRGFTSDAPIYAISLLCAVLLMVNGFDYIDGFYHKYFSNFLEYQMVVVGVLLIKYLPSLDYVVPSVLGHHERWDGNGYPRGLAGKAIPVGTRCLCLADSFDAMVSRRIYKEAMSVEEAIQEIRRNLGTQFDPEIGQLFIQLIETGKIRVNQAGAR